MSRYTRNEHQRDRAAEILAPWGVPPEAVRAVYDIGYAQAVRDMMSEAVARFEGAMDAAYGELMPDNQKGL